MLTRTYTERKKKYKSLQLADNCLRCGLFEHAASPKLLCKQLQDGQRGRVLIVLGTPSQAEDLRKQLGGDATGSTVKKYMKQYLQDCAVWITCPVKCYPKDYEVKTHEVRWCSSLLKEEIDKIKPNKVIAMGDLARMACKEIDQEYESSIHPKQLKDKALDRTIIESYSRTGAECRDELEEIPVHPSFDEVLEEAIKEGYIGLDFEWNIDTDVTHTIGISSSTKCAAVPLEFEMRALLRERICKNPFLTVVGHNIVSDVTRILRIVGADYIDCQFMDTLILKRQLAPHLPVGGLKFFAHNYLHLVDYAKEITIDDFAQTTKKLQDYCAGDAYAGLKLYYMFKQDYPEYWKIMTLARDIDMKMILPVAQMIHQGIKVDMDKLKEYTKHNNKELDKVLTKINKTYDINPSSPAQVKETLQSLGYDVDGTGESILKGINHEFASDVLQYRKYNKLNTTYTTKIPELVGKSGRLHCNLQLASTTTGRMTSTNPNMQNIPPGVRPCFKSIFDEEGTLLTVDASQSELRCLAYLSGSKYLIDAYNKGSDMHTLTSELAGITRKNAKILNFAYVYGATEQRLSSELVKAGLSRTKARTTTRTYLDVMSKIGIANYQKKLLTSAKKIGYTSSVYGRIGDRMNPTQVVNFPIQSFSADLNKIRILEMHNLLRQHKCISRLWLEFHDAMELDVYKPELELVYNLIEQVDTRIPDINNSGIVLDLPLDIKEHGPNWN